MCSQMLLRLVGFPGADRSSDQAVMPHDVLRLAGRRQMESAQTVDMTAAAAHQRPDVLLTGCGIKLGMEIVVCRHEFLEVAGLCELLLARNDPVQLSADVFVGNRGQQANDLEFKRLP